MMAKKKNNAETDKTNELSSEYFAGILEKLKNLEEEFGDQADFMMLKMVVEHETLEPGSALNIEIDGMSLIITPTDTAEDIREKLDSFMALIEKQAKAIIEKTREKTKEATKDVPQIKGIHEAIESLGDKYQELIEDDYSLISLDISWDGEVSAAFYPNDDDHTKRKYIPIGALNNEQKKRMTKLAEWQKSKYPEETLKEGAFVITLENKKFNGLDSRVTRKGGGWYWSSVTGFKGKIPDLEFEETEPLTEEAEEAEKRSIAEEQWKALLHMADAKGEDQNWIDKTFTFPGRGIIKVDGALNLKNCISLRHLPDNLEVSGNLELKGCISLRYLSEGLKIGGNLNMRNCTALTHLPDNLEATDINIEGCISITHLPEELDLNSLYATGCTSLTHLPENLKTYFVLSLDGCTSLTHLPENLGKGYYIGLISCTSITHLPENLQANTLYLINCDSLTGLPDNLRVDEKLYLSNDLNDQVKEDVEKLKKEGKIKGIIEYA